MGACLSRKLASSSPSSSPSSLKSSKHGAKIRVVHLNGRMEEFEDAITVGEVTGEYNKEGKHFVFAQAQLMSLVHSKPLDSATQLEMGNIYFLLPHSFFQTEMSPIDLGIISKRLTLAATQKSVKAGPSSRTIMPAHADDSSAGAKKKKKTKKQREVTRNRYADRYVAPRNNNNLSDGTTRGDIDSSSNLVIMKQQQEPCSWKPILECIAERSLTRAESDS